LGGNLQSLKGYDNTSRTYDFYRLFENCTLIKGFENTLESDTLSEQVNILPLTKLATHCYEEMFINCTGLENLPLLPAPTASDYSYAGMFKGCTNLSEISELPLTKLENLYTCKQMFMNCSKLKTVPAVLFNKLTGIHIQQETCMEMFKNCISLTTVSPEFFGTKITHLHANACNGMFAGCENLTEIPYTSLATVIYGTSSACTNMFKDCIKLTNINNLTLNIIGASGWSPTYVYENMFAGCTSLSEINQNIFDKYKASSIYEGMFKNMFAGCTSLTEAPALPATKLANNCYERMFSDCTSLANAPALPATKLANNCYKEMFAGCTSLSVIPVFPNVLITAEPSAFNGMFKNCISLETVDQVFIARCS
jgi:hypothetical protein